MQEILIEGAKEFGLILSEKQIQQFEDYYKLLIEWNEVMNLTAITDYDEVQKKHFLDSISLYKIDGFAKKYNDLKNGKNDKNIKVTDVGTGAGFPGIPIKIMFPEIEVVLMDSLNKRVKFLNEVIEKLKLKGISAYHARAEEFAKKEEFRENFDYCVSRAVANMSTLAEYCIPFVKLGGELIAYKTSKSAEEIENAYNAIRILGGKAETLDTFKLPNSDIERKFVVIKKIKNTPKKYPRGQGKPSKEPL